MPVEIACFFYKMALKLSPTTPFSSTYYLKKNHTDSFFLIFQIQICKNWQLHPTTLSSFVWKKSF